MTTTTADVTEIDELPTNLAGHELDSTDEDGAGCAKTDATFTWKDDEGALVQISEKRGEFRVQEFPNGIDSLMPEVNEIGEFLSMDAAIEAAENYIA